MINWITLAEAIAQTDTSDRTIRRWVKEHQNSQIHVKREGRTIFINAIELDKNYPLKTTRQNDGIGRQNDGNETKTTQMQIVSYSETITRLSEQIERRDNEIQQLLGRKSKLPIWLTIGFLLLILAIACVFAAYTYQMSYLHKKELDTQTNAFFAQKQNIKENLKNQETVVEELKEEITVKREELAQKDRLISELYNDTKEQNKKLLELTESLKNEVIKNEQKENNLPAKEAQN